MWKDWSVKRYCHRILLQKTKWEYEQIDSALCDIFSVSFRNWNVKFLIYFNSICCVIPFETEESNFTLGIKEMKHVMEKAIQFTDQNDKVENKESFLRNLQSYMMNHYYKKVLFSLLASYHDYESGILGSTL